MNRETKRRSKPMPPDVAARTKAMIEENSSVIPVTGCWMWMRTLTSRPHYGMVTWGPWRSCGVTWMALGSRWTSAEESRFRLFGPSWRPKQAHRLSLAAHQGRFLIGGDVDHLCNHPWCVNPAHLEWVTPAENQRRAISRRRRAKQALKAAS